jgi:lantibiotic modifying enzyme
MKRLPLFEKKISRKIAEKRCNEISSSLTGYCRDPNNIGYMTGLAGISCFFFHYFKYTGNKKFRDLGYSALEKVLDTIDNGFNNPSFSTGLAGISWTFRYLGSMGFITSEESNVLNGLHPLFMSYAKREFESGNYDFLHGALGMWMTADPFPGEELAAEQKTQRKLTGEIIISGITGSILKEADGSAYWINHDTGMKDAEINMGMAHGMPSIVSVLCRIFENYGHESIMDGLIIPGVNYILKQADDNMVQGSAFPVSIGTGPSKYPSRMAWCYGDPGVAISVFNAGRICKKDAWVNTAERILVQASARKSPGDTKVGDSCLCHGSSGLSTIYYILWIKTGKEEFRQAAEYWAEVSLNYGDIESKRGKYLFHRGNEVYESHYSFLEGECGVGLSLLSMLDGNLPVWARSLLLV